MSSVGLPDPLQVAGSGSGICSVFVSSLKRSLLPTRVLPKFFAFSVCPVSVEICFILETSELVDNSAFQFSPTFLKECGLWG